MSNTNEYNPVRYTYIPHLYGRKAKYRNDPDIGGFTDMHDLEVFYDKIAKDPQIVTKKDDVELWAPATFIARRRKSDVLAVHCMVYDVDCGLEFSAHKEFAKFDYVAHTSYSHTEEHHKWRIVLPLKKSVPANEWKFAWAAGSEMFKVYTKASADQVCKDSSRAYHVAGCTEERRVLYRSVMNKTGRRFGLTYSTYEPKKRHFGKIRTFTQEEFEQYNNAVVDETERTAIAQRIGAEIIGNTARKGKCPQCHRRSLWFFINVDGSMYNARCNHLNSCGYTGSLLDL